MSDTGSELNGLGRGVQMPRPLPAFSHSAELGKIALALAKAQGSMEAASKDRLNPHFKSKYADLAAVMDACRAPLAANELAITQPVTSATSGVVITTMLIHSSGEWMRSDCVFPVGQQTAQGYGSAITYARRYCAMAMLGIAPDEDDDGNAASAQPPKQEAPAAGKRTAQLKEKLAAKTAKTDEVPTQEPVVPEGSLQGKRFAELSDKELSWYAANAGTRWPAETMAALQAEVARRRQ